MRRRAAGRHVAAQPKLRDVVVRHSQRALGRPPIHDDAVLLQAAFKAFAEHGYESMSVRAVAEGLGLSHGALNRRFGGKREIFEAAITHGFEDMFAAMTAEQAARPEPTDDLAKLEEMIRSFLIVNCMRPEFGQLMNMEGLHRTEQLDYIAKRSVAPFALALSAMLHRLGEAGVIHPIAARSLFFLVAHCAEAPFTLNGLSSYFDDVDGPFDAETHIEQTVAFVMRGITR